MSFTRVVLVLSVCVYLLNGAKFDHRFGFYQPSYLKPVEMICSYEGEFKAFHSPNGTKITTGGRFIVKDVMKDGIKLNKKVLDIVKVKEEDYGIYTCEDSKSNGTATLEITATILDSDKVQTLAVGFEGAIKAAVYMNPKQEIAWSYGKTAADLAPIAVLDKTGNMVSGSDKYQITPRGALVIKMVTSENSGVYRISLKTDGIKEANDVTVTVGAKPSVKTKPEVTYTKTSNQQLVIPCSWNDADGLPTWTFTDKKNKVKKTLSENIDANGLTIKSIQIENEGSYTCSASNKFGSGVEQTTIEQVIVPPAITSNFTDQKKFLKSKYTLTCNVTGIPTPSVVIMKDTEVLVSSKSGAASHTFPELSVGNSGNYNCEAKNGATTVDGKPMAVKKSMKLEILTPPSIIESTKSVASAVGLGFKVVCLAQANPDPIVLIKQNGTELHTTIEMKNRIVTATFVVVSAKKENFMDIVCEAVNIAGKQNKTVKVIEVVKANPPDGLTMPRAAGLEYIDLSWNAVKNAVEYIVYINDTSTQNTTSTKISIKNLQRNTTYSFCVASKNLAGVGSKSAEVVYKTSSITRPGPAINFRGVVVTSSSGKIEWDPPSNVAKNDIVTYKVMYCEVDNTTRVAGSCHSLPEKGIKNVELRNLAKGTTYEVEVYAFNQAVQGTIATFKFTTKKVQPTESPAASKGGLGTGAMAGIIIVIILVLLAIVDMFCCFFNNCGVTHCCYETFCAKKSKKYAPADTKDEEAQELKPKADETV